MIHNFDPEVLRRILGDWPRGGAQAPNPHTNWSDSVDWSQIPDDQVEREIAQRSNPERERRLNNIYDLVRPAMGVLTGGKDLVERTRVFALHNGVPTQCVTEERGGGWNVLINDGLADLVSHITYYVDLEMVGLGGEDGKFPDIDIGLECEVARRMLLLEGAHLRHAGRLWQPIRATLPGTLGIFPYLVSECATAFVLCHELAHVYFGSLARKGASSYDWRGQTLQFDQEEYETHSELMCDELGLRLLLEAVNLAKDGFHGIKQELVPWAVLCTLAGFQIADNRMYVRPPQTHPLPWLRLNRCLGIVSTEGGFDARAVVAPLESSIGSLEAPSWRFPRKTIIDVISRSRLASISPVLEGRSESLVMMEVMDILAALYSVDTNFLFYAICIADEQRVEIDNAFLAGLRYPTSAHFHDVAQVFDRIQCGRKGVWELAHRGAVIGAVTEVVSPVTETTMADWWLKSSLRVPTCEIPLVTRVLYGAATGVEPAFPSSPSRSRELQ